MKKILVSIIFGLFALSALADHEITPGEVYFQNVPALCGVPEKIQAYIDHEDMAPFYISLGREGMIPEGDAVYMMTIMTNPEMTESMSIIDVPSGTERCILYHTFDLTKVDKSE